MSQTNRFERTAAAYAEEASRRDWRPLVEWCLPDAGDSALDVAAGPGMLSAALLGSVRRAVALDASAGLLAHAPEVVETIVGDASDLPFADGSFDIVTCVNGLHHLDHPELALAEMARVLAPGGRIVLQDYLADPDPVRAERWDEIERLRADDHRRLPRDGDAWSWLARRGVAIDEEREWESTWQVARWVELAGCDAATAARIEELIGAPTFTIRSWRARYVKTRVG